MVKKFVVGILIKNDKYLAEERQEYEDYFPGKVIFPGGLIKKDETSEKALVREMEEELTILIKKYYFVGEFYYKDGASSKVYAITKWKGSPEPIEAKRLVWVKKENQLSNKTDKEMFKKIKGKGFQYRPIETKSEI